MPIIAVLNEKGGVGKTTIATNLARGLQLAGHDVVFIDSDPQGSARDWKAAADERDLSLFPVIGLDRPALFKDLPTITKGAAWVVIDGAPSIEALAAAAIRSSEYVLIPVQPSPYDVWATESLVELVRTRQQIANEIPRAAFVISRQIVGTKLATEVRGALNEYELPILESFTSQRVIYSTSAANGSTVLDDEPKSSAADEIRNIVNEVAAWD